MNSIKRKTLYLFSILSFIAVMSAFVLPSSAYAYPSGVQRYQFYLYRDGNGNGYPDWSGLDTCVRGGRTAILTDLGASPAANYNIPLSATADFSITTALEMASCSTGSTAIYYLYAPGRNYSLWRQSSLINWNTAYSSDPAIIYGMGLKYSGT